LDKLKDIDITQAPIPPKLLRKYIGYAKKYCPNPKLQDEACEVLQEFYLSLRESQTTVDFTPITTRQLESLIRLAQARAKLELRDEVTKEDAEDVVYLMRQSLKEAFEDDFECFDFRRTSTISKRKLMTSFISILTKIAKKHSNRIFAYQDLLNVAKESRMDIPDFEDFISTLNYEGFLLLAGHRKYQLQTI